jgi:hypothetical protein
MLPDDSLMRSLVILGGAVFGGLAGYLAGVYVACFWLYPESNLCGLVGVIVTGPIGLLAGAILAWFYSRT